MTLRHLKIFIEVYETGSTTAAAERLCIVQPSVSHAISEMEKYYGIKLFDRIAKRLYITEAGKRLFHYATHIVGSFEEMEREMRNFDASGVIRVGASITIGNYLLPNYIKEFKESHPNMEVKVIIDNSETIKQYVIENKIDLGLIEGMVHNPFIIKNEFRDDELIMICANSHPFADRMDIEIDQIQQEKFIMRENGSAVREIFDSIMTLQGIQIDPIWESTSTQAIVRAVGANLGVSVLPYLLVKDSLDRKEIKQFRIKDVTFQRKFSIIYHKSKFITQCAREFIKLCR